MEEKQNLSPPLLRNSPCTAVYTSWGVHTDLQAAISSCNFVNCLLQLLKEQGSSKASHRELIIPPVIRLPTATWTYDPLKCCRICALCEILGTAWRRNLLSPTELLNQRATTSRTKSQPSSSDQLLEILSCEVGKLTCSPTLKSKPQRLTKIDLREATNSCSPVLPPQVRGEINTAFTWWQDTPTPRMAQNPGSSAEIPTMTCRCLTMSSPRGRTTHVYSITCHSLPKSSRANRHYISLISVSNTSL